MTFLEMQDRVMGRLNLTSTESRTLVKGYLNDRYRRLCTSIGLGKLRRATMSFNTVATTATYTPASVVKPYTVSYPTGRFVLDERTEEEVRAMDPGLTNTGVPVRFAVLSYTATGVLIRLHPTPDAIYAISVDAIMSGTTLTADADVAVFPIDFHDILVLGGLADAATKLEKLDVAQGFEDDSTRRTRELRYFLAKSGYLHRRQNSGITASDIEWRRWGII